MRVLTDQSSHQIRRRLRWSPGVISGIVILILIAGAWVFHESNEHKSDAFRVAYTGREREQASQLARQHERLLEAESLGEQRQRSAQMQETFDAWREVHRQLSELEDDDLVDLVDREWFEQRVATMDELLAEIGQRVDRLVDVVGSSDTRLSREALHEAVGAWEIDLYHRRYVAVIDSLDLRLARQAHQGLWLLIVVDSILILLPCLLLLFVCWFMLRPSLELIGRQMRSLHLQGQQAAHGRQGLARDLIDQERWARHFEDLHHGITHDARSPLTAVILAAELAARSHRPEEVTDHLHRIARNARQAIALLERALTSGVQLEAKAVAVEPWLREVVDRHRVQSGSQGHAIVMELDPGTPRELRLDTARAERVLHNLLDNALTHAGGAEIRVEVDGDGEAAQLAIRVEDDGPGMSQEALDELMRSPLRPRPSGSGGFGIGLGIARRLAEHMGGQLRGSAAPGQGCRFELLLRPLEALQVPPPALPRDVLGSLRDSRVLEHVRVLLLDDDPEVRETIARVVAELGGECDATGDPADLMGRIQSGDAYHLVLLDAHINGHQDGLDLAADLRRMEVPAPVVLITGDRARLDPARCMDQGCDDVLFKPIATHDLAEKLLRWAGGLG